MVIVRAKRYAPIADSYLQPKQRKGTWGRHSSRSYTENAALFGGYRLAAFAVRNAMNHSLHCQTKRQKTEKHHKKFAKSNKNY